MSIGTSVLGAAGGPAGLALEGGLTTAPLIASAVQKIGSGRRAANSFVQTYEDQLGKVVLPQVIAMAKAGNTEGAKALLQQGLQTYQQGVQQGQQGGGSGQKVANQSLQNKALNDTISSISSSLGMGTYTPGVGLTGTGQPGTSTDPQSQAKAALYGLGAPLQQGDPFALKAPTVSPGFTPQTLAGMKANAMEAPAAAGAQEMSQAKIALSQGGLAGSPAAAALRSTVARQTGQAQQAGMRDVQTQNAQKALDQSNLQKQYNWGAQTGNFNELNNRYAGARNALTGG